METAEKHTAASVWRGSWKTRGFTLIWFQKQASLEFCGACRRLARLCGGGELGKPEFILWFL